MFLGGGWGGGDRDSRCSWVFKHKNIAGLGFFLGGRMGMTFDMVCICVLPNHNGKKSVFLVFLYSLIFCHQIIL